MKACLTFEKPTAFITKTIYIVNGKYNKYLTVRKC